MRNYRKWLPYEVAALEEWAGTVPTHEIAERLGRSIRSIKLKAMRLDIPLRCNWHLEWCHGCSCWRTSIDANTGECQVCKVRQKMQATEAECTALYLALGPDSKGQRGGVMPGKRSKPIKTPRPPNLNGMTKPERCEAEQRFFEELEEWHLANVQRRYATARKRLQRAREDFMNMKKDETNPGQKGKRNDEDNHSGRGTGADARSEEADRQPREGA